MTLKTQGRDILYTLFDGDQLVTSEVLRNGDNMVTPLTVVASEDETEYVGNLASHVEALPELPDTGWLEQGAIYAYEGEAIMVRQAHMRTIYPPEQTPALFVVYREDAAGLDWIVGEPVTVGARRVYNGTLYECLQAHVTQSDWTPPAVPALWKVVVEEPQTNEWAAGVAYKIGDVVTYAGREYSCRQTHTAQLGWEPPQVLALWMPL